MTEKQQAKNPEIKKLVGTSGFTKEFREQVIEVYNSGVYASMAECARNYNVIINYLVTIYYAKSSNFK